MIKKILIALFSIFAIGCVDEVDLSITSNGTIEDILIVEATLTDELKRHQVTLSKIDTILDLEIDSTFNPFTPNRNIDRNLVNYEENAQVTISSGSGNQFTFLEISPGIYESQMAFAAQANETYELNIQTASGKGFSSKEVGISGVSAIENIYAERMTSDLGVEGIGIFIDNNGVNGDSQNFRYSYDETYKIIAPNWSPRRFKLTNYDPCALPVPTYDLEIVDQEEETKVCYATVPSNTIIQGQLPNSNGGGVKKFLVRFLGSDNFAISHRYSIEVSQMVSSSESYGFYENLNNFSQNGNIFSQVQPGFLEGNLSADDGSTAAVIGFFDVVSISRERLFFNYTDFYPNEDLPPFPFNCTLLSSPESHVSYCSSGPSLGNPCPQSVIEQVNLGLITYVGNNEASIGACPGPYVYVSRICGDCTNLGSNAVPEFWEE
jgi:hypothetical protein